MYIKPLQTLYDANNVVQNRIFLISYFSTYYSLPAVILGGPEIKKDTEGNRNKKRKEKSPG